MRLCRPIKSSALCFSLHAKVLSRICPAWLAAAGHVRAKTLACRLNHRALDSIGRQILMSVWLFDRSVSQTDQNAQFCRHGMALDLVIVFSSCLETGGETLQPHIALCHLLPLDWTAQNITAASIIYD